MARRKRQLRVRVLQRGGAPEAVSFMEDMTQRIVAKMFSTRMANTLNLRIELRASKLDTNTSGQAHHSTVHDPADKKYTIIIHRDLRASEMARTLAHELAHVKQYAEGRLRPGKHSGEAGRFWKPTTEGEGQFFPYATTAYFTSPWEVEAREMSKLGSEALQERLTFGNDNADNPVGQMFQRENRAVELNAYAANDRQAQRRREAKRDRRRRVLGIRI